MKIKFIDPRGTTPGLNTGLAYLAGILIAEGHEVEVIDLNNYLPHREERLERLRDADIIGISIKTSTRNEALELGAITKKINPDAVLICGGIHITLNGLDFMENNSIFDIAAIGEGEITIIDIASGKPLDQIAGIIFRDGNSIIKTDSKLLRDLDSLPFPDYLCFDSISKYKVPYPYDAYPIITSRGCPSRCIFCSVPLVLGKKWRARSPENIIAELKHMKEMYGLNKFDIRDDTFTLKMLRAKEFCRLLIEKDMGLEWSCAGGIKAKFTDRELAGLMKEAGAVKVSFGIESTVPEIHESIGKGETLDDVFRAIRNYKEQGIRVGGFFLIGLPGSNKELDRKSIESSTRMGLDTVIWSILVPYPGTKLHEMITNDKHYNLLLEWAEGTSFGYGIKGMNVIYDSSDYSAEERKENFFYGNLRNKNYGALLNMHESYFRKAITLLKIILRYDLKRFPWHLYYVFLSLLERLWEPQSNRR